jgi:hypothetical protein
VSQLFSSAVSATQVCRENQQLTITATIVATMRITRTRFDESSLSTGSGSPQCGQVAALGETALPQTLHGFISSGIATQ